MQDICRWPTFRKLNAVNARADTGHMSLPHASYDVAELEARLLGVLLTAESARHGAQSLLDAFAPLFDDGPAALAIRDRDGVRLHVLAEAVKLLDGPAPGRWRGLAASP